MADDVKPDEGETVSEPLQDDPASEDVESDEQLDDSEPKEAVVEEGASEHTLEPRTKETGKYSFYGGWTCQSGSAYNGIEKSNEHPTKNG